MEYSLHKTALADQGYTIINDFYTPSETQQIVQALQSASDETENMQSDDLYAIRKLFRQIPGLKQPVFTLNLCNLVKQLFGTDYFLVKTIYLDKPALSNWVVAWHHNLFISVKKQSRHSWIRALDGKTRPVQRAATGKRPAIRLYRTDSPGPRHQRQWRIGCKPRLPQTGHHQGYSGTKHSNSRWYHDHAAAALACFPQEHIRHGPAHVAPQFSNQSLPQPLEWAEKEII